MKSRLEAILASIVTHLLTSSTIDIALIKSVDGMDICLPSSQENALFSESLPEMKGESKGIEPSWQACAARTSEPNVSGFLQLPQQKLSSRAILSARPPTHIRFLIASSIPLSAIQYGSISP